MKLRSPDEDVTAYSGALYFIVARHSVYFRELTC